MRVETGEKEYEIVPDPALEPQSFDIFFCVVCFVLSDLLLFRVSVVACYVRV